jgi:hypothetical protein
VYIRNENSGQAAQIGYAFKQGGDTEESACNHMTFTTQLAQGQDSAFSYLFLAAPPLPSGATDVIVCSSNSAKVGVLSAQNGCVP